MSEQPLALRLADELMQAAGDYGQFYESIEYETATELRRQHSEIVRLTEIHTLYQDKTTRLKAERDALQQCLFQAQEAAKSMGAERDVLNDEVELMDRCIKGMRDNADKLAAERHAAVKLAQDYAREAYEDVEGWSAYASEYFQRKWNREGDLAKWLERGTPNAAREVQQIDAARGDK